MWYRNNYKNLIYRGFTLLKSQNRQILPTTDVISGRRLKKN